MNISDLNGSKEEMTNFEKIKNLSVGKMAEFINKDLWLFCKSQKCQETCTICVKKMARK